MALFYLKGLLHLQRKSLSHWLFMTKLWKDKRILFKLISKIKKSAINKYPIYGVDEPRKLILHATELDFTGTYTNIPRVNGMGYCSITLQDFYVS